MMGRMSVLDIFGRAYCCLEGLESLDGLTKTAVRRLVRDVRAEYAGVSGTQSPSDKGKRELPQREIGINLREKRN